MDRTGTRQTQAHSETCLGDNKLPTPWRTAHPDNFSQDESPRPGLAFRGTLPHKPLLLQGGPQPRMLLCRSRGPRTGRSRITLRGLQVLTETVPLAAAVCLLSPPPGETWSAIGRWHGHRAGSGWIGSISEGATNPQLGGRRANILPCLLMEPWLEGHFVDHGVEQKAG